MKGIDGGGAGREIGTGETEEETIGKEIEAEEITTIAIAEIGSIDTKIEVMSGVMIEEVQLALLINPLKSLKMM